MKSRLGTILIAVLLLSAAGISQVIALKPDGEPKNSHYTAEIAYQASAQGFIKFEEAFADSAALANWTIVNADQSINNSVGKFSNFLIYSNGDSILPQSGTYFWASNFSNANGFLLDEWLISPMLPEVERGDTLFFWGGAVGGSYDDSLQIRLATSDPQGNIAAFTHTLERLKMAGPVGSWTLYRVPLDSALWRGMPVWIAFRYWHTNGGATGSNSDNVWLDHISIVNNAPAGIGDNPIVPQVAELHQNFPNPFNPATTFAYSLPRSAMVSVTIYNAMGQQVRHWPAMRQSAGQYLITWDGRDSRQNAVASGIFYYQLTVNGAAQTRKMHLVR